MSYSRHKRRTRGHIVGDLAVNYVERQFLLAGHAVDRTQSDYGIDLWIYMFDAAGDLENGAVQVQVKGSEHLRMVDAGRAIVQRMEVAHLNHWIREPHPVIVAIYDVRNDVAYWDHVQAHFRDLAGFVAPKMANYKSLRIPSSSTLDRAGVRRIQGIERMRTR